MSVNEINDNILNDISIKINLKNFSNLIKKLDNNISYQNIIDITRFFMKNGYGGNIILREMSKKIITSNKLNDLQKSMIFLKLSKLDHLLNNGSDEELIIINFLSYFSYVLNNYNKI